MFFSKWSRVMMLKLSEDVGLRDDGLNGCHLEPSMHAPRAQRQHLFREESWLVQFPPLVFTSTTSGSGTGRGGWS